MLTVIVYLFCAKPKALAPVERAKAETPLSNSRSSPRKFLFFLLSWEKATSTRQHNLFVLKVLVDTISHQQLKYTTIVYFYSNMTLTNGDSSNGSSQLMSGQKILDYRDALEVLHDDYSNADGLDAKTLLDSKINGGLTYNDFLVLPGYIGTSKSPRSRNFC